MELTVHPPVLGIRVVSKQIQGWESETSEGSLELTVITLLPQGQSHPLSMGMAEVEHYLSTLLWSFFILENHVAIMSQDVQLFR